MIRLTRLIGIVCILLIFSLSLCACKSDDPTTDASVDKASAATTVSANNPDGNIDTTTTVNRDGIPTVNPDNNQTDKSGNKGTDSQETTPANTATTVSPVVSPSENNTPKATNATPSSAKASKVSAHFRREGESTASLPEYKLSYSEIAMPAVFQCEGDVTDFCIVALDLTGNSPNPYKARETMLSAELLTDGQSFVAWIDFPGDLSAWGCSYTDNTGTSRSYLIYMSGEDGSLTMTEGTF